MSPDLKPLRNHRSRCSDVPWVKVSGTAYPCVCFWMRSSPTALAAFIPSWMSPASRMFFIRCAWCAQTPAKVRLEFEPDAEPIVLILAHPRASPIYLVHDPQKFLHVVADFVGDHVSLGEVAGSVETPLQL